MNPISSAKASPGLINCNSRTHSLHLPILMLTLVTAGAHFYLAAQPDEELRFFFLLNGIGYLTLVSAFVLPKLLTIHHIVRWIFTGYAMLTIILWFFLGSPSEGKLDPFDLSVKAVELLLVIFLFLDKKLEKFGA